nr:hypothetical protein [Methanobrevibacter smithii]
MQFSFSISYRQTIFNPSLVLIVGSAIGVIIIKLIYKFLYSGKEASPN